MVVGPDRDETGLVCAITVKVNFTRPILNYLFRSLCAGALIFAKKTTFQGHSNS